jgi:hypothetical protein
MPLNLNTNVHIVSKDGLKETTTVRDLIARGEGNHFEALKMLDGYELLSIDYDAERRARAAAEAEIAAAADFLLEEARLAEIRAEEEMADRYDHLPDGAHLLPQDYQDFLYNWNKTIASSHGDWVGPERDAYKRDHPLLFKRFLEENTRFKKLYSEQVEQVKAYQAEHKDDPVDEPADVPDVPDVQEVQPEVQPEAEVQPEVHAEPEVQPQVKPLISYNHPRWPSPMPKVFVQRIRGNNAWNYTYPGKTAWAPDFKAEWQIAGNTEFKLTHENCIRYLAHRMGGRTIEQFLEMTREEVGRNLRLGRLPNSLFR